MNDDHRSYTQPTHLRKESLQTFLASNDQHCPGGLVVLIIFTIIKSKTNIHN